MFNKSKGDGEVFSSARAVPTGSSFSVIGSDVEITGNIKATNDLHVDGLVVGDVECASLVQGSGAIIRGAINADSAKIGGTVEGSILAVNLVVEASAKILGDVTYGDIRMENGGIIEGQLKLKTGNVAQLEPKQDEAIAG